MEGMQPAAGSLLIASATLVDPNFARCVLLVLESNEDGSLGVIINQPSETAVGEVLDAVARRGQPAGGVLPGRPGGAQRGTGARDRSVIRRAPTRRLSAGARSPGALGLVDLDSSPDDFLGRLAGLRIYAGYAGWGAGQLDDEIAEGSWHVVPAQRSDLFSDSPERLWREILRRQPPPLSMLATLPRP